MVKWLNIPLMNSPSKFLSSPPNGWKPRTQAMHDVMLFEALDECEALDEHKAKKKHSEKKRSASSTTTSRRRRRVLMSLDDVNIQQEDNSTSQQLFLPEKTTMNKANEQQQEPFAVAIINLERETTRKVAAIATADLYDKHGWV